MMRQGRGFTLIELLVVIAIISLLSSIVLASLNSARSKARDAQRRAEIRQIQTALEMYRDANGSYPPSGGATSPNSGWNSSNDASWNTLQASLAPYMSKLPIDPKQDATGWAQSGQYVFSYFSSGYGCDRGWYMIVFRLETASGLDPGVKSCDGTGFQYGGAGSNTAVKTVGMNGYPY